MNILYADIRITYFVIKCKYFLRLSQEFKKQVGLNVLKVLIGWEKKVRRKIKRMIVVIVKMKR